MNGFTLPFLLTRLQPTATPVVLRRGRIYMLPTRHGFLFGLVLLVMLLGSINYNNNLAFALTFLLGGVALVSMLHTHRNLSGLAVSAGRTEPVFAGQNARIPVHLQAALPPMRYAIAVTGLHGSGETVDVPSGPVVRATLIAPAKRRGLQKAGTCKLSTVFPLGLFRAWTWVDLNSEIVVYPAPLDGRDLECRHSSVDHGQSSTQAGQDDFHGLRGYLPGDSLRHIAWKRLPVSQQLLTKQFAADTGKPTWLDWDDLVEADAEQRLSRLCGEVLRANERGDHYGLRLPDARVEPDTGELHKHRCLQALALFQSGQPDGSGS